MNKKKKTTRIKHRKNKERMKKHLQVSLLKAKPKKVETIPVVEEVPEIKAKAVKIVPTKKPASIKKTAKKAPTKKATTKKATTKKSTTKKTPAKKQSSKKAASKKAPAKKTTAKKD